MPRDSAWLRRGFLQSVRMHIANDTILANAPRTMVEAILESREAACGRLEHNAMGIAANMVLEWIRFARSPFEGRAIKAPSKNKILVFPNKS